jgi:hypothetical protein
MKIECSREIERAVLREGRDPEIERCLGMEIGQDEELAGLVLLLVQLRRIECGDGLTVEEAYARERRHAGVVRNSKWPLNRLAIAVTRFSASMMFSR